MARYERDFMGRVRGMFERMAGNEHAESRSRRNTLRGATGPGAEGYYLTPEMARETDAAMDYRDRGWDDGGDRGFMPGMTQFGRAGVGRGYGGDYRTGRGGYDRADFFVNRHPGDDGYRPGYQRDLGSTQPMRGGEMRGHGGYGSTQRARYDMGFGYAADYRGRGGGMDYDRGYRGGHAPRGGGILNNADDMNRGMRGYYSGTAREGGVIGQTSTERGMVPPAGREHVGGRHNHTPFPYTRDR